MTPGTCLNCLSRSQSSAVFRSLREYPLPTTRYRKSSPIAFHGDSVACGPVRRQADGDEQERRGEDDHGHPQCRGDDSLDHVGTPVRR